MRLREYSDDEEALLDASVGERCVSSGVRGDGDELLEDDDAENAIVGAASRDDGNSILSEGKTGLSSSGPSEYSDGDEYNDEREETVAGKLARVLGGTSSGDCASTAGCHTCSSVIPCVTSTIGASISPRSVRSSCVAMLTTLLRRIISVEGRELKL